MVASAKLFPGKIPPCLEYLETKIHEKVCILSSLPPGPERFNLDLERARLVTLMWRLRGYGDPPF